jgi:valyl-tRNA synthetase
MVTTALGRFDLGEAARLLYEFIWNEFCDWYIELTKKRLYDKENQDGRNTAQSILQEVLEGTMRLLHPFMPFLTEEIWQHLNAIGKTIMLQDYPKLSGYKDEKIEAEMNLLMDVIRAVRNIRAEMNVAPGRKADLILAAADDSAKDILNAGIQEIKQLAMADKVTITDGKGAEPPQSASAVLNSVTVYVPLKGLLDFDKEIAKVRKEIEAGVKEKERLEGKLNNDGFIAKAPADVVAKEREKLQAVISRLQTLKNRLAELSI